MNEELLQLLITAPETIVLISFSAPHDSNALCERVRIRPVELKGKLAFQIEEFTKTQSFTKNSPKLQFEGYMKQFSQAVFRFRDKEFHLRMNKEGVVSSKSKNVQATLSLEHNRKKPYLIAEDEPIDFLIHLGIQNKQGKVLREKYDKFKQINQFILLLKPLFESYKKG